LRDKTNPKTGETRQIEEIYAAAVKKPQETMKAQE
jgi:hypothetical protein